MGRKKKCKHSHILYRILQFKRKQQQQIEGTPVFQELIRGVKIITHGNHARTLQSNQPSTCAETVPSTGGLLIWAGLREERTHLQCGRRGLNPWIGNIPWRKKWQPTPVFLPGEPHGQRSPGGYSPGGHKSWTRLSTYA